MRPTAVSASPATADRVIECRADVLYLAEPPVLRHLDRTAMHRHFIDAGETYILWTQFPNGLLQLRRVESCIQHSRSAAEYLGVHRD